MKLSRRVSIPTMMILLALAGTRSARAQDREDGTNANLLLSIPYDRITLGDNKTFTIEPIVPRPLPPLEAAKPEEKKVEKKAEDAGGEEKDEAPAVNPGEEEIKFSMLSAPGGDYLVKRKDIKGILYFEDMLLSKGDELLQRKDYGTAFEHFLYSAKPSTLNGAESRIG